MSSFNPRISFANAYDNSVRNISSRQSSLANLQDNLTSGKRVVRTSDDPTSAAIAERALTRLSRIAADQRALESQRNAIALAESTLGEVTDTLQAFRELVVSAGNGGHTDAERKSIAFQLSGLRDNIVSLSNLKDTNGQPLFGSLGSATTPFVGPQAVTPDYTFDGLPGQSASGSVSIPFALDGDSAFMLHPGRDVSYSVNNSNAASKLQVNAPTLTNATLVTTSSYTISNIVVSAGATAGTSKVTYDRTETPQGSSTPLAPVSVTSADYPSTATTFPVVLPGVSLTVSGTPTAADSLTITPNASVFSVMDSAIKDLSNPTNSNGLTQTVAMTLYNIDIAMQRVSGVRGQAGDLLTRADRITTNQDKRSSQLEADRSRAEDLDMIKGISDFNNQQTGYQAALQTYAQIQKLSLFNFIG